MFTVENVVGRLIEVRISAPVLRDEVTLLEREMSQHLQARAPAIVCFDVRETGVLDPANAALVLERTRAEDARVERQAVLLPSDNAVAAMQVGRVLREAASSHRRAFHSRVELAVWLDDVLTPRERARLTMFLYESSSVRARATNQRARRAI